MASVEDTEQQDRAAAMQEEWATQLDAETRRKLAKLTHKQFGYVQNYLRQGMSKRQAVLAAGYAPSVADAYAPSETTHAVIAGYRSSQMRDRDQERRDHLAALERIRNAAEAAGKFGPAATAETNRGKVMGLYNAKSDLEEKKDAVDLANSLARFLNAAEKNPALKGMIGTLVGHTPSGN